MNHCKRTLALILTALLAASAVSCGGGDVPADTTTAADVSGETTAAPVKEGPREETPIICPRSISKVHLCAFTTAAAMM